MQCDAGDIGNKFRSVMQNVAAAARKARRDPSQVTVVAVSKSQPAEAIIAAVAAGARTIGENYVQETAGKFTTVREAARRLGVRLSWHLVGHLQRNKVRQALGLFTRIQSLGSAALAQVIEREAEKLDLVVPVLVQVNLAGEESKSGVSPEELGDLLEVAARLPHLRVDGLMTIPPPVAEPEEARPHFQRLRLLRDEQARPGLELKELSMGMSADYTVAVEEGATMVRVGQAIFGPRKLKGVSR